jgi:hypothetical protein
VTGGWQARAGQEEGAKRGGARVRRPPLPPRRLVLARRSLPLSHTHTHNNPSLPCITHDISRASPSTDTQRREKDNRLLSVPHPPTSPSSLSLPRPERRKEGQAWRPLAGPGRSCPSGSSRRGRGGEPRPLRVRRAAGVLCKGGRAACALSSLSLCSLQAPVSLSHARVTLHTHPQQETQRLLTEPGECTRASSSAAAALHAPPFALLLTPSLNPHQPPPSRQPQSPGSPRPRRKRTSGTST